MNPLFDWLTKSEVAHEANCEPHPTFGDAIWVIKTKLAVDSDESTATETKYHPFCQMDSPESSLFLMTKKFKEQKSIAKLFKKLYKKVQIELKETREAKMARMLECLHFGAAVNSLSGGKAGKGGKGIVFGKYKVPGKVAFNFEGIMDAAAAEKLTQKIKDQLSPEAVEEFEGFIQVAIDTTGESDSEFVNECITDRDVEDVKDVADALFPIVGEMRVLCQDLAATVVGIEKIKALQSEHEGSAIFEAFADSLKPPAGKAYTESEYRFYQVTNEDGEPNGALLVAEAPVPGADPLDYYTFYVPAVFCFPKKV